MTQNNRKGKKKFEKEWAIKLKELEAQREKGLKGKSKSEVKSILVQWAQQDEKAKQAGEEKFNQEQNKELESNKLELNNQLNERAKNSLIELQTAVKAAELKFIGFSSDLDRRQTADRHKLERQLMQVRVSVDLARKSLRPRSLSLTSV